MRSTKLKKLFAGVTIMTLLALFSPHLSYYTAEAVTQFPPAALLQPNDITTSHIRDGDILPADLSQTSGRYWDMKGDWHVSGSASTTGALIVGGNLTISGTCTGCSGSNLITPLTSGMAISAGDAVLVASSTNKVNTLSIQLGTATDLHIGESTSQPSTQIAQSFKSGDVGVIESIRYKAKKVGAPADNLIFSLQIDSSGAPSGTMLASSTLAGSSLSTSYTVATTTLDVPVKLAANTTYWFVVDRSGANDNANYYDFETSNSSVYEGGAAAQLNGTWTTITYDIRLNFEYGATEGALYPTYASSTAGVASFIGFAESSISKGASGNVIIGGLANGVSGVATGTIMYLSTTAGALQPQAATVSRKVGVGIDGDSVIVTNTP